MGNCFDKEPKKKQQKYSPDSTSQLDNSPHGSQPDGPRSGENDERESRTDRGIAEQQKGGNSNTSMQIAKKSEDVLATQDIDVQLKDKTTNEIGQDVQGDKVTETRKSTNNLTPSAQTSGTIDQEKDNRDTEKKQANLPVRGNHSRASDGDGVTVKRATSNAKLNTCIQGNTFKVTGREQGNGNNQVGRLQTEAVGQTEKQDQDRQSGEKGKENNKRNNQEGSSQTMADDQTANVPCASLKQEKDRHSGMSGKKEEENNKGKNHEGNSQTRVEDQTTNVSPNSEKRERGGPSGGKEKESNKGNNQVGGSQTGVDDQTINMSRDSEKQEKGGQSVEKEKGNNKGHIENKEIQGSTTEPRSLDRKLEKENKELKRQLQEKEEMLAEQKKDQLKKEDKIKELEEEIKETQDRADKNINNKRERKSTKDNEGLKQKLTKMKTEKDDAIAKMQGIMNDMEKVKDAVLAKKAKEIRNLEKEKEELLCRLSAMAGSRLTDNNPNIADLSDLNRPTKLAEKYSELYDNEWTDAFSYLQTVGAFEDPETDVIAALVSMLTKAYTLSLMTATTQLNTVRKTLNDFHVNTPGQTQKVNDVIKQLKDDRKKSIHPSKELAEEYRNELEKSFSFLKPSSFDSDALSCYLKKCLELCWLMAIQDPPVYILYEGCKKGDRFDKNWYKEYTQSGRLILYIVWPAVFLEKDGALLCKGVVQCEKRKSSSFRNPKARAPADVKIRPRSLYENSKTLSMPTTTFRPGDKANEGIQNSSRNAETNKSESDKYKEPIYVSEML